MSGTISISLIRDSLKNKPWQYRLKLVDKELPSNWSKWILNPSGNYVETENNEPVLLSEIDWIEINPLENKRIGRLVSERITNHTSEICQMLDNLNIEYVIDNKVVRMKNICS